MKKIILIASLLFPYQNFSMNCSSTSTDVHLNHEFVEIASMSALIVIGLIGYAKLTYQNRQLQKDLSYTKNEHKKLIILHQNFINHNQESNNDLSRNNYEYREIANYLRFENDWLKKKNQSLKSEIENSRTHPIPKKESVSFVV